MIQKVFIIWATWNVWKELVKQIIEKDNYKYHKNPSIIVWLANSSWFIFNKLGFENSFLKDIFYSENVREKFTSICEKYNKLEDLVDIVDNYWLDGEVVFVDVTAWKKELLNFHKYVILNSNNFLVTANKNPISLYSMEDFNLLTSYSWRYNTNTTVMWWAWILEFVENRVNKLADKILKIEWVFSGTLSYILSQLNKWEKKFSDIVKFAKEQGYTEPNPYDDLNWLDVARKLVILARYSWYDVSIKDIMIKPLIDEKYWNYEWEEFLEKIKNEDSYFENLVKKANDESKILAYVAEMIVENNKAKLEVWLKIVDKNSEYWNLSWTLNLAIVETEILKEPMPHIIKSRWAWLAVTASSVRYWIAKMLPNFIKNK